MARVNPSASASRVASGTKSSFAADEAEKSAAETAATHASCALRSAARRAADSRTAHAVVIGTLCGSAQYVPASAETSSAITRAASAATEPGETGGESGRSRASSLVRSSPRVSAVLRGFAAPVVNTLNSSSAASTSSGCRSRTRDRGATRDARNATANARHAIAFSAFASAPVRSASPFESRGLAFVGLRGITSLGPPASNACRHTVSAQPATMAATGALAARTGRRTETTPSFERFLLRADVVARRKHASMVRRASSLRGCARNSNAPGASPSESRLGMTPPASSKSGASISSSGSSSDSAVESVSARSNPRSSASATRRAPAATARSATVSLKETAVADSMAPRCANASCIVASSRANVSAETETPGSASAEREDVSARQTSGGSAPPLRFANAAAKDSAWLWSLASSRSRSRAARTAASYSSSLCAVSTAASHRSTCARYARTHRAHDASVEDSSSERHFPPADSGSALSSGTPSWSGGGGGPRASHADHSTAEGMPGAAQYAWHRPPRIERRAVSNHALEVGSSDGRDASPDERRLSARRSAATARPTASSSSTRAAMAPCRLRERNAITRVTSREVW